MRRFSPTKLLDWGIPLGFGLAVGAFAPMRVALQFGGDEGYELMKGLLVSKGYHLYSEIWNDQPPLHTEVVALVFRLFGASALAARLVTLACSCLLVAVLYRLVRRSAGPVAGFISVILLASFSFFFQLSVSAMLELPAMTLGLVSMWSLSRYFETQRKTWLLVSGTVFACALQVKLTAVLFGPVLVAQYVVATYRGNDNGIPQGWRCSLHKSALIWCVAALLSTMIIFLAFYDREALRVFWSSHFSAATRQTAASVGPQFQIGSLYNELAFAPAIAGLMLLAWKRLWHLMSPAILLITSLIIHMRIGPYWSYYSLHFAIPMAWLGAAGIVGWFGVISHYDPNGLVRTNILRIVGVIGWCTVMALVLAPLPNKVSYELGKIRKVPHANTDPILCDLRTHSFPGQWVFTDRVIYPFWAGLAVPPPLAVIPSKRIWSGEITEEDIIKNLRQYQPAEVLLLSDWANKRALLSYLAQNYDAIPSTSAGVLYVRVDEGRYRD